MARRRRYRRRNPLWPVVVVCSCIISATAWWLRSGGEPGERSTGDAETGVATVPLTPMIAKTQKTPPGTPVGTRVTLDDPQDAPSQTPPPLGSDARVESPAGGTATTQPKPQQPASEVIARADAALSAGDLLTARTYFLDALGAGVSETEEGRIRAELVRIGDVTIFSPRIVDGDTLVARYTIQVGDTMGRIARKYRVSAELIAAINNIRNVNLIRAGQVLKVINGPFHAVVRKSDFAMDVYLGSVLVRQFPVGLGSDDSTPTGAWRVGTKLVNPTYYPPRGGNVIAADDPENPLGGRWIALDGVSGAAAGAVRYGIHGTIEPESIGRSVSLGCIRMHNKDVELLYTYLVEKHSTVKILP